MNTLNAAAPRRATWRTAASLALLSGLAALLVACSNGGDPLPAATPLSITVQPTDQSATSGGDASFTIATSAVGSGASVQWQTLTAGTWTNIAGATASTLTMTGITLAQNGTQYRAVVTGSGLTVISTQVTLSVTAAPVAPSITVQPVNQAVTEPASGTFNVTAAGSATLAYQWQRNLAGTWTPIAGATGPSFATPATSRASDNGAQFRVVISNGIGSETSEVVMLTVEPAPVAPAFTTQPLNVTVTEPATASFTVAATGTPAPTLQWQVSTDAGATWNSVASGTGATSASYSTAATTVAMNGWRYRAVATSNAGAANSNAAVLTVNAATSAPVITQQPAGATVVSSSTATFTVVATGSPSPTYQWQRRAPSGGSFFNITGATGASYTTPPVYYLDDDVGTDNGAQYRVVASNSQGSATSAPATLVVTLNSAAITGFTQISAGQNHVLALRNDGTVWAWGTNGYGQVGRSCIECSPRAVSGLTGTFTQVLARGDTSFALRSDGTVWAWGYNGSGQLGRNLAAGTNSSTPAQVVRQNDGLPLAGIVGMTMTNAGGFGGQASVLAWTAAGVAWKWGHAWFEPGLGGFPNSVFLSAVPHVHLDGSTTARSVTRAAAGGNGLVAFIDAAGTPRFWRGDSGGITTAALPVPGFSGTAIDMAASDGERLLVIRSDNTLWGQAYQDNGNIIVWNLLNQPLVQIALPEGVSRVAISRFGVVTYVVGLSGTVYSAGDDTEGMLGDGTIGGRRTNFAPVLTINDATAAVVGHISGLALRPGGAIWGWGDNTYRTIGTTDSANRPVGSPGWIAVEASPYATRGR